MNQTGEQAVNIASCMADTLLSLDGVKGVVVVIDWEDPKHPALGVFHTKQVDVKNALSLVRRGAQMQTSMVNTILQQGTTPPKEEPDNHAKSAANTDTQIVLPGCPPLGGHPAPVGS